ncbi:MAG: hypothetical protein ACRDRL_19685 [Sciscionella sp.]
MGSLEAVLAGVGDRAVDLDALCGTWHVVRSTLPLWRARSDVTISYSSLPDGQTARLDDVVAYGSTRRKTIIGVDSQDAKHPRLFHWRGTGLLSRLASSDWVLVGNDENYRQWALSYFSRTLFTPAGMDVYARNESADDATVASIVDTYTGIGPIAELVPLLFIPGSRQVNG